MVRVTGVLREGVHQYLRTLPPYVALPETAGYDEGGAGLRTVILKWKYNLKMCMSGNKKGSKLLGPCYLLYR